MKRYLHLLQAACAILTIALIVNGTDVESLMQRHADEPIAYLIKVIVQMILALLIARVVDLAVSLSGSTLRWIRHRRGSPRDKYPRDKSIWRSTTPEGLIVGIVVVGVGLGWSPKDVYPHPDEPRQSELRYPSLLENPLLLPPGSRGITTLIVSFRDSKKYTSSQTTWEFTTDTATERVTGRTILWSTSGPERGIVKLNSGDCLFFPDPIGEMDQCPPDDVIEAYLTGESRDYIQLMMMDVEE